MDLPKPMLAWDIITSLDFLTEVEILRGREDVRKKPWARETSHKAIRAWTKLQHAKEELLIIGIEASRIWASIRDEEDHLSTITTSTRSHNPLLAGYISMVFRKRLNANSHLRCKLAKLAGHGGYALPTKGATSRSSLDSQLVVPSTTTSMSGFQPTQQGKRVFELCSLSANDFAWHVLSFNLNRSRCGYSWRRQ